MSRRRIEEAFARARTEGRCALIPYITAGDPSLAATVEIAVALAGAGADIIELGVPFSDPVADGPVIQAASERALANGVRLVDVLECARAIRARSEIGLLLFTYYNPVLRMGLERFAAAAKTAGGDGVLVTDVIPEEAGAYRAAVQGAGLDTVFLAAPTSPDERLAAIARASSGFVYAVSRLGVTGANAGAMPETAGPLVARLRRHTSLPIALGFGISRHEQVAAVAKIADGAVVGSALVQMVAGAAPGQEAAAAVGFLQGLRPFQARS